MDNVTISKEVLSEMLEILRTASCIGSEIVYQGLHKNPEDIPNNTLIFAPELYEWSDELTEMSKEYFNNNYQ